uniref:DUF148 domain-containing protein n=1 Tax=Rhabditophanes sp. KR3021 TaxID=114890 RepID=A0AC35UA80_9BILA
MASTVSADCVDLGGNCAQPNFCNEPIPPTCVDQIGGNGPNSCTALAYLSFTMALPNAADPEMENGDANMFEAKHPEVNKLKDKLSDAAKAELKDILKNINSTRVAQEAAIDALFNSDVVTAADKAIYTKFKAIADMTKTQIFANLDAAYNQLTPTQQALYDKLKNAYNDNTETIKDFWKNIMTITSAANKTDIEAVKKAIKEAVKDAIKTIKSSTPEPST